MMIFVTGKTATGYRAAHMVRRGRTC